jgi:hypothetical protein
MFIFAAGEALGPEAPPRGLMCLPRYYVGEITRRDDTGWGLVLPDGTFLPWDDGKVKTLEEREAGPDLEDLFAVPYRAGKIEPVVGEGEIDEPGRIRLEQLLKATYGGTARTVELKKLRFFGLRYPVAARALPAFERVAKRLEEAAEKDKKLLKWLQPIGGTWQWRTIARSRSLSTHSWGIALDLNPEKTEYWRWAIPAKPIRWKNRTPQAIVDAFEAEGFVWGGRWLHYDTMHFEYRPELLDPKCQAPEQGVADPVLTTQP